MTWNINAQGFTGDVEAAARLMEELAAVFAKPEYGTGSTLFNSPTLMKPNFHYREPTEDTPDEGVTAGTVPPAVVPTGPTPVTDPAPPPASDTPEGTG